MRRTELDGVREEVPDDLPEPIRIGEERSGIRIEEGCQLDVLRFGQAPDSLDCLLDDGDRIGVADVLAGILVVLSATLTLHCGSVLTATEMSLGYITQ